MDTISLLFIIWSKKISWHCIIKISDFIIQSYTACTVRLEEVRVTHCLPRDVIHFSANKKTINATNKTTRVFSRVLSAKANMYHIYQIFPIVKLNYKLYNEWWSSRHKNVEIINCHCVITHKTDKIAENWSKNNV